MNYVCYIFCLFRKGEQIFIFLKKREFYVFLVLYVDEGFALSPKYPHEQ